MFHGTVPDAPVEIGFLLLPNFSMGGFVSAVEPLRLANWVSDRTLYRWQLISRDGGPVAGSNGSTAGWRVRRARRPKRQRRISCRPVRTATNWR